jgi:hypothetical protein
MTQNPYSPPANIETVIFHPLSPRPISAWLLLIAIALNGSVFAVRTAQLLFLIAYRFDQLHSQWGALLAVGWRILVGGVLLAGFVGILKRKQWGRWLGLLMLASFAAFGIFVSAQDTTGYDNEMQRAGGLFAQRILIPLLLAWWAYAFGFSTKAKLYFAQTS